MCRRKSRSRTLTSLHPQLPRNRLSTAQRIIQQRLRLIRISEAATIAPKCSVNFLECTLRVGEENGTLKAKVVKRKRISPKGQIECSLHTPLLRRYAMEENFWTKPTITLVAKKIGSNSQIWLRVMTLTYAKEIPRTIIATAYAKTSVLVGLKREPVFLHCFDLRV